MQHIQAPEQAERLIERCREIFDSEPVFTSEVGPVIGTYTGPGLIGVGGCPRALLDLSAQRLSVAAAAPTQHAHADREARQRPRRR